MSIDLTTVLSEDIWYEIIKEIPIRDRKSLFMASTSLQLTSLDAIKVKRNNYMVKITYLEPQDEYGEVKTPIFFTSSLDESLITVYKQFIQLNHWLVTEFDDLTLARLEFLSAFDYPWEWQERIENHVNINGVFPNWNSFDVPLFKAEIYSIPEGDLIMTGDQIWQRMIWDDTDSTFFDMWLEETFEIDE